MAKHLKSKGSDPPPTAASTAGGRAGTTRPADTAWTSIAGCWNSSRPPPAWGSYHPGQLGVPAIHGVRRLPRWFDAIDAVPLRDRYRALADAWDRLITATDGRRPTATAPSNCTTRWTSRFSRRWKTAHPAARARAAAGAPSGPSLTASYGKPPHLDMHSLPPGSERRSSTCTATACWMRCSSASTSAPKGPRIPQCRTPGSAAGRCPVRGRYGRPAGWNTGPPWSPTRWSTATTGSTRRWDSWLSRTTGSTGRSCGARSRPVVAVAAGHAGKTCRRWWAKDGLATRHSGGLEEGPIGRELAERGIRTALDNGVWGMVLCSTPRRTTRCGPTPGNSA